MNSSIGFVDHADRVTHSTPSSHWCPGCWSWVLDCNHMVNPLPGPRHPVKDVWIRSLNYYSGKLEVEFTWFCDVRQFYPVRPELYREILYSKAPKTLLEPRVMDAKGIQCNYVRNERQQLAVLLKGAEMVMRREGRF